MSSTHAEPLDLVERGLDELAAIDPGYRTTAEKQEVLVRLSRVIARAEAARMRVLAVADDVADATRVRFRRRCGWPTRPGRRTGTLRRDAALADALDSRWHRGSGRRSPRVR